MAGARLTTFRRGDLVFDVADSGPEGGEIVVLLHGFPQSSSSWEVLAPLLHGMGYRTLAPDQRGYSPRARPAGRRPYRSEELVADVVALIDAAGGEPVHVVGHDWGAIVAWATAASRPDAVLSLTALSVPHPAAFVRAVVSSRQVLASWYMYVFQLPWVPERMLTADAGGRTRFEELMLRSGQRPDRARRDVSRLLEPGALTAAINWYRAIPLGDPRRAWQPVGTPTLYVWSDGDTAVSRAAAENCGRHVIGPYRFEVLPGVSHWIPEEAPEEVARLLEPHLAGTGRGAGARSRRPRG